MIRVRLWRYSNSVDITIQKDEYYKLLDWANQAGIEVYKLNNE